MPMPPVSVRVYHSGFYADGRPNTSSILIDDVQDTGQVNQAQRVPVYIPPGGFIQIPFSDAVMFSYTQGSIDQMITAGLVTAYIRPLSGSLSSDGVQTALVTNDGTETAMFTLVIPGNTLRIGDLVRVFYLVDFVARASGNVLLRTYMSPVGWPTSMDVLQTGNFPITSQQVNGLEFSQFGVIDTGGGLAAARLAGLQAGVAVASIDLTIDQTVTFTAQATIVNPGNSYRGLFASLNVM